MRIRSLLVQQKPDDSILVFSPQRRHDAKHPRSHLGTVSRSIIGMTRVSAMPIDRHPHPTCDHVVRLETIHNVGMERELRNSGKVKKRPPLRRGKVSKRLPVPDHIPKPPYVNSNSLPELSKDHQMHDSEGIACMRAACELAARVLDYAGTLVRPSVTTDQIDKAVHQMIIDAGAYPSPLGYGGFPKSVCTSVNECMCHGIPDTRQLQGYHGDTSKTFLCGDVDEEAKRLVKITEECLEKAISICGDGVLFKKIGKKISDHAESFPINAVVLNCMTGNDRPGRMVEGQTFTIEPILTTGSIECVEWDDKWTTLTDDGSLAAQFEHTLLITSTGAEILTKY
ncbi:Methionine aminopeptidase 1B, chloroplastic [Asimina triloba]